MGNWFVFVSTLISGFWTKHVKLCCVTAEIWVECKPICYDQYVRTVEIWLRFGWISFEHDIWLFGFWIASSNTFIWYSWREESPFLLLFLFILGRSQAEFLYFEFVCLVLLVMVNNGLILYVVLEVPNFMRDLRYWLNRLVLLVGSKGCMHCIALQAESEACPHSVPTEPRFWIN